MINLIKKLRKGFAYNEGKKGVHIHWLPSICLIVISFNLFLKTRIRIFYAGDRWRACVVSYFSEKQYTDFINQVFSK